MTDVLPFPRRRQPAWSRFPLEPLVREVIESFAPRLDGQRIVADVDVPVELRLVADRELVRQAIVQLVCRALEAMPRGGELDVIGWSGRRGVELEVADSGSGLEVPAGGPRLAGRFPTFDGAARTCAGTERAELREVQRIVEVLGGRIAAANCPQGGAALTLVFPHRSLEAAA